MPLNQTLRKNSTVLWTISIIQDQNPYAQTKSEFSEMADDIINTHTIANVTLCKADGLQRFRLMIQNGMTEEEALKECKKMSDKWDEDNSASLEKLRESKNLSFITWDEFLNCPTYIIKVKAIEDLYKENREFRNDVDGRIRQELKNIKSDAKITYNIQQTALLKQYLFEECAFQKFCAGKKFEYEIYKTPMNKAMRRIKNNSDFVPPGYMVEVHFSQFNTSEKKQLVNSSLMHPQKINSNVTSSIEKESFSTVFSKKSKSSETSSTTKLTEFIEKTIQMLPPKQQQKAIEELFKFTTQNIIPLYYETSENTIKL